MILLCVAFILWRQCGSRWAARSKTPSRQRYQNLHGGEDDAFDVESVGEEAKEDDNAAVPDAPWSHQPGASAVSALLHLTRRLTAGSSLGHRIRLVATVPALAAHVQRARAQPGFDGGDS